jgi:hypothetical protein
MTYNELAERIIAERNKVAEHNSKTPYYFLNVGHPALMGLYAEWKPNTTPPSDKERLVWELKQLNADALKKIAEKFKEDNCGR